MAVKKTITKKQQNDYKKKCKASLIFDEDVPKTQEVLDEQEDKYFTEACHERDKKLQDIFNKCLCRMQMEIANTCCKESDAMVHLKATRNDGIFDANTCAIEFEEKQFSFLKMLTVYLEQSKADTFRLGLEVETRLMSSELSNRIDVMEKQIEQYKTTCALIDKQLEEIQNKVISKLQS